MEEGEDDIEGEHLRVIIVVELGARLKTSVKGRLETRVRVSVRVRVRVRVSASANTRLEFVHISAVLDQFRVGGRPSHAASSQR